jgi:hypothetical protein
MVGGDVEDPLDDPTRGDPTMQTMTVPAVPALDTAFSRPPMGWRRRGVAAAAVVLLLMVAVQGWMPQVLSRVAPDGGAAAAIRHEPASPVDVDAVAERARYAIEPVSGRTGALQVVGDSYRAGFDRAGFTYTPTGGAEPFALSLTDVARGGRDIALGPHAWTADGNVASRPVADGIREQVTARKGEVEWDLVLAERPAGRGDLFVGASLAGVVGAPTRAGAGWELRLDDGQTVKMGEVVVVDADHHVLHRGRPTIDHGRLGLRVPDAALQKAAYPLTVDPTVGSRIPLAAGLIAPDHVGVAFDGTNFLVVWHEYHTETSTYRVRGRRVSGDGQTVFAGFDISTITAYYAWYPDVVWTGSNFLVVWERRFSDADLDVHGQFVSSGGTLVGTTLFIANGGGAQSRPAVTSAGDGTGYVVWQDNQNGNGFDIFGARVNADGSLPDPNGRAVAVSTPAEVRPDVAFNGDVYLVAFERDATASDADVQAQLVFRSGALSGGRISVSVITGTGEALPAVASDNNQFLVAWQDSRGGGDVRAARVNGAGAVLDSPGIAVATSSAQQKAPAVAFSGIFLVAWSEENSSSGFGGVRAARVTGNGAVSDPNGFVVRSSNSQGNAFSPAVSRGAGSEKWAVGYVFGGSAGIEANLVSSK